MLCYIKQTSFETIHTDVSNASFGESEREWNLSPITWAVATGHDTRETGGSVVLPHGARHV